MKAPPTLRRFHVALLMILSALPVATTSFYLPSLVAIQTTYQATAQEVQWTLTLYLIVFGFSQLIYGYLGDIFGRRPIIIAGLSTFTAATLLCVLAPSINILILGRVLQALGAGSSVLAVAVLRDGFDGSGLVRLLSYLAAAVSLSPLLAPTLGGFFQKYFFWQAGFWLFGGISLLLLVSIVRFLPETGQRQSRPPSFPDFTKNLLSLFRLRAFTIPALTATFTFGALFAFISGSPHVFMGAYALPSDIFGLLFSVSSLGYLGGSLLNPRVNERFGPRQTVFLGLLIVSIGGLSMTFAETASKVNVAVTAIVLLQIVCEVGIGWILPTCLSRAMQPVPHLAGQASALIGFMRFCCAGLASTILAVIPSLLGMALTIVGFAILSGACWLGGRHQEP